MKSFKLLPVIIFAFLTSCSFYQSNLSKSWEKIATKTIDSVVIVEIRDEDLRLVGMGSGVVISDDGWIVTNKHVVTDYVGDIAENISIRFENNRIQHTKKIIVSQNQDLALIKIEAKNLKFLKIRKKSVVVGEPCLAVGSPFPYQWVIKEGVIAAKEFKHFFGPDVEENGDSFFVHSSTLHGGNSGGALIDNRGKLIGINTAGYNPPGPFTYGLSIRASVIISFINFVDPAIL